MDLADLQVFLTLARERNFTRAAEKLFRTQPAVSLTIRRLEEWAGEPLVVRGARNVTLTDAGRLLADYAGRLVNLREETRRAINDLRELRRGELSLGANESSIHALLPALARFRRLYPEVHIAVHRTFSRDIPREVLSYRLDLGVLSYLPQDPHLAATEFYRDELALVVHPRHRLARRRKIDITDLGRETFIAHIVESPFRARVIEMFRRHRVPLNMTVELPTIESIKRFVQMEMGVAIVPRMCVGWEVERGLLRELRLRQMKIPRHLYLIRRRETRLSHTANALLRLLDLKAGVPPHA